MAEQEYLDKIYSVLKDNMDGFDRTPEQFRELMKSSSYSDKVYSVLKDNVDGFDRTPDQFKELISKKKINTQVGSQEQQQKSTTNTSQSVSTSNVQSTSPTVQTPQSIAKPTQQSNNTFSSVGVKGNTKAFEQAFEQDKKDNAPNKNNVQIIGTKQKGNGYNDVSGVNDIIQKAKNIATDNKTKVPEKQIEPTIEPINKNKKEDNTTFKGADILFKKNALDATAGDTEKDQVDYAKILTEDDIKSRLSDTDKHIYDINTKIDNLKKWVTAANNYGNTELSKQYQTELSELQTKNDKLYIKRNADIDADIEKMQKQLASGVKTVTEDNPSLSQFGFPINSNLTKEVPLTDNDKQLLKNNITTLKAKKEDVLNDKSVIDEHKQNIISDVSELENSGVIKSNMSDLDKLRVLYGVKYTQLNELKKKAGTGIIDKVGQSIAQRIPHYDDGVTKKIKNLEGELDAISTYVAINKSNNNTDGFLKTAVLKFADGVSQTTQHNTSQEDAIKAQGVMQEAGISPKDKTQEEILQTRTLGKDKGQLSEKVGATIGETAEFVTELAATSLITSPILASAGNIMKGTELAKAVTKVAKTVDYVIKEQPLLSKIYTPISKVFPKVDALAKEGISMEALNQANNRLRGEQHFGEGFKTGVTFGVGGYLANPLEKGLSALTGIKPNLLTKTISGITGRTLSEGVKMEFNELAEQYQHSGNSEEFIKGVKEKYGDLDEDLVKALNYLSLGTYFTLFTKGHGENEKKATLATEWINYVKSKMKGRNKDIFENVQNDLTQEVNVVNNEQDKVVNDVFSDAKSKEQQNTTIGTATAKEGSGTLTKTKVDIANKNVRGIKLSGEEKDFYDAFKGEIDKLASSITNTHKGDVILHDKEVYKVDNNGNVTNDSGELVPIDKAEDIKSNGKIINITSEDKSEQDKTIKTDNNEITSTKPANTGEKQNDSEGVQESKPNDNGLGGGNAEPTEKQKAEQPKTSQEEQPKVEQQNSGTVDRIKKEIEELQMKSDLLKDKKGIISKIEKQKVDEKISSLNLELKKVSEQPKIEPHTIEQPKVEQPKVSEQPKVEPISVEQSKVEPIKVSEQQQTKQPKVGILDIVNNKVEYNGDKGNIVVDNENNVIFKGDKKDIELGKTTDDDFVKKDISELGVKIKTEPKITVDNNTVQVDNEKQELVSINHDKDGNVISYTYKNEKGEERTNRDADIALDIAIKKNNQSFDESRENAKETDKRQDEAHVKTEVKTEYGDSIGYILETMPDEVFDTMDLMDKGIMLEPKSIQDMVLRTLDAINNARKKIKNSNSNDLEKDKAIEKLNNFENDLNKYYEKLNKQSEVYDKDATNTETTKNDTKPNREEDKSKKGNDIRFQILGEKGAETWKSETDFEPITEAQSKTLLDRLNKAFGGAVRVFSDWNKFKKIAKELGLSDKDVEGVRFSFAEPYYSRQEVYEAFDTITNLLENKEESVKTIAETLFRNLTKNKDSRVGLTSKYYWTGKKINGRDIVIRVSNHEHRLSNVEEDTYLISVVVGKESGIDINETYAEFGLKDSYANLDDNLFEIVERIREIQDDIQFMQYPDGTVYGAVLPDGSMYLNPKKINANSHIHEHTHLFNQVIQKTNPKLWAKMVDAVKNTALWNEVKNDPNYANLKTDNQIADEVYSRLTGKKGAVNWRERIAKADSKSMLGKVREVLKEYWNNVKQLLGADIYKGMSADDFADMTLDKLFSGKEIKGARESIDSNNPQHGQPLFMAVGDGVENEKNKDIIDDIKFALDNGYSESDIRKIYSNENNGGVSKAKFDMLFDYAKNGNTSEKTKEIFNDDNPIGTKKSINNELYDALGLKPIDLPGGTPMKDAFINGKKLVESGLKNPLEIVERILSKKDNPSEVYVNEQDENVMLYYRQQLHEQGKGLARAVVDLEKKVKDNPQDIDAKMELMTTKALQLTNLDNLESALMASQVAGRAGSRFFNARQVAVDSQGIVALNIKRIKIIYGNDMPKDLEQELTKLQAEYDTLSEKNAKIQEEYESLKKEKEKTQAQKIVEDINTKVNTDSKANNKGSFRKKADALADKFEKLFSSIVFKDDNGNDIDVIQNGIISSKDIIKGISDLIRITGSVADAVDTFFANNDKTISFSQKAINAIKEHILSNFNKDNKLSISRLSVKDAIRENNLKNIDEVVLHFNEKYPEKSEREIRDAITGYGVSKEPNSEDADIRKMIRLGRIKSALEDIKNNKRPMRSGMQRDKIEADERALQKELKRLIDDMPKTDADINKQLKSSQDAIETRLNNEIEELDRLINGGKRVETKKGGNVEYTDDIKNLITIRDAKKQQLADIEGIDRTNNLLITIKDKAESLGLKTISKEIVKSKLIDDLVKSQLQDGVNVNDVIDNTFDKLKTLLPELTKSELHNAILKKGDYVGDKKTKTALQQQLAELKRQGSLQKQIEDIQNGIAKETKVRGEQSETVKALQQQLAELKRQGRNKYASLSTAEIKKQIRTLETRLNKGEFANPKTKDRVFEDNQDWISNNTKLTALKNKIQMHTKEAMESKKSSYMRTLDYINRWARRAIFWYNFGVYIKLNAAAASTFIHRIPSQLIATGYKKIFPHIGNLSPEAQFDIKAEAKFYLEGFNLKKLAINSWSIATKGTTELSKEHEMYIDKNPEFAKNFKNSNGIIGKTLSIPKTLLTAEHIPILDLLAAGGHILIKDPVKRATFEATFEYYLKFYKSKGLDINNPLTLESARQEAYKAAKYEIFLDNGRAVAKFDKILSDKKREAINDYQNAKNGYDVFKANAKYTIGALKDFFVPVNTVPNNIVRRFSLPIKLPFVLAEAYKTNKSIRDGISTLSTEQANHIFRDLKNGSIGSAYWSLGFYLGMKGLAGGLYTAFLKDKDRDKKIAKHDELIVGDTHVSHAVQHAWQLEDLQMGAEFAIVYHHFSNDKDGSEYAKIANGVTHGVIASSGSALQQLPMVQTASDMHKATQSEYGYKKFKNNLVRRVGYVKALQLLKTMGLSDKADEYEKKDKPKEYKGF